MPDKPRPCIKCGTLIEPTDFGYENRAVHCEVVCGYGSKFDTDRLDFIICDGCIESGANRGRIIVHDSISASVADLPNASTPVDATETGNRRQAAADGGTSQQTPADCAARAMEITESVFPHGAIEITRQDDECGTPIVDVSTPGTVAELVAKNSQWHELMAAENLDFILSVDIEAGGAEETPERRPIPKGWNQLNEDGTVTDSTDVAGGAAGRPETSPAAYGCGCLHCLRTRFAVDGTGRAIELTRMIVCRGCGNKRCPHAEHHANLCTRSNKSGQPRKYKAVTLTYGKNLGMGPIDGSPSDQEPAAGDDGDVTEESGGFLVDETKAIYDEAMKSAVEGEVCPECGKTLWIEYGGWECAGCGGPRDPVRAIQDEIAGLTELQQARIRAGMIAEVKS